MVPHPQQLTPRKVHAWRFGVWSAGWSGLDWVDDLGPKGKAIDLGGNGYPRRYTARIKYIIPNIIEGLPSKARPIFALDEGNILTDHPT